MSPNDSLAAPIDITSIGAAALDVFIRAPHEITKENEQNFIRFPLGAKIKIEEVVQTCGGGATNTAVGFSRLGLSAQFCGVIGDDEWGQSIVKALRKDGVLMDTAIIVTGEVSSFSIILLDAATGQRTILYAPNVNAHLCDPVFPKDELSRSRWIFLNHLTDVSCVVLDDLCEIVCATDHHLAWNPGGSQIRGGYDAPIVRDILRHTDILFLNAEEAMEFMRVKSIPEAMLVGTHAGAKIVCITDGPRGAYLSDSKECFFSPAMQDVEVVDSTGAGDAFAVGVTWAHIKGRSLQTTLLAGMINAASVIGAVGAQTGLLTDTVLAERIAKHPFPPSALS